MENVKELINDEERCLELDPDEVKGDGEIVETADYFVGQAYNGHIQVIDKADGSMCMHISCTQMLPKERLQAFADRLPAAGCSDTEAYIRAVQAL